MGMMNVFFSKQAAVNVIGGMLLVALYFVTPAAALADTIPTLIKDLYPGNTATPYDFTFVGDTLFFVGEDERGYELWKSDGTEAGTVIVKDINEVSPVGSEPQNLTAVGELLFFTANDAIAGEQLWVSDGTEDGTVMIGDFSASQLVAGNGVLYFVGVDPATGMELWKSDGTEEGTVLVKDIYVGVDEEDVPSSMPMNLVVIGDTLFFQATSPDMFPTTLWKSDGTEEGTIQVLDSAGNLVDLSSPASADTLTKVGDKLYFTATDITDPDGEGPLEAPGAELWISDGTQEGTHMVVDVLPGSDDDYNILSSNPSNLVASGGLVYFNAVNGFIVSDGTEEGTIILKDYAVYHATDIGGTLYFIDQENELWKTDGTEGGTVFIKNVTITGSGYNMTDVDGTLYFTAYTEEDGSELWKSDGTEAGTVMIYDLYTGVTDGFPNSTSPNHLTYHAPNLYFSAWTADSIGGLWSMVPGPEIIPEPSPEPSPAPSPSSSSSNSSSSRSSSSISAPGCSEQKPEGNIDLFQINTTRSSANLYFTPLLSTSSYVISFSTKPHAEEHGEQVMLAREGVQGHSIFFLSPNTTYYVKVRGQNGCMPGDWSNIMEFKTRSKSILSFLPFYRYLTALR
jgi:ELWxxDGT repeat protein